MICEKTEILQKIGERLFDKSLKNAEMVLDIFDEDEKQWIIKGILRKKQQLN